MTYLLCQYLPFTWQSTLNGKPQLERAWSCQHGKGGKFACLSRGGWACLSDANTSQNWEWN